MYGAMKRRLFLRQGAGDVAVWNSDDAEVMKRRIPEQIPAAPAAREFSTRGPVDDGAFAEGGDVVMASRGVARAAAAGRRAAAPRPPQPHERARRALRRRVPWGLRCRGPRGADPLPRTRASPGIGHDRGGRGVRERLEGHQRRARSRWRSRASSGRSCSSPGGRDKGQDFRPLAERDPSRGRAPGADRRRRAPARAGVARRSHRCGADPRRGSGCGFRSARARSALRCCSRRGARRSTCSATSRTAAASSRPRSSAWRGRGWREPRRPHAAAAAAGPHRGRRGDGLFVERHPRHHALPEPRLLLRAPAVSRAARRARDAVVRARAAAHARGARALDDGGAAAPAGRGGGGRPCLQRRHALAQGRTVHAPADRSRAARQPWCSWRGGSSAIRRARKDFWRGVARAARPGRRARGVDPAAAEPEQRLAADAHRAGDDLPGRGAPPASA